MASPAAASLPPFPAWQRSVSTRPGDVHAPEEAPAEEYDRCLHQLVVEQALRTPSETAVVDVNGEMSYGKLHRLTDELAAYLKRRCGCVPETVVGIFMERCAEYVVAYLAALKAGSAYCPIELAYPESLVAKVFKSVDPITTLTKAQHEARIPKDAKRFCLDDGWAKNLPDYPEDLTILQQGPQPTLESLVYVVYSGGSTGEPKGIEATHRSPVASYLWRLSISGYRVGARVGCNVFFVWECLRPLMRGGACVVIPDDVIFDSSAVTAFLRKYEITEVLFTPSLLESVMNTGACSKPGELAAMLPKLQVIWMNGEVVTVKLLQEARRQLPRVALLNTYSISECGEVAAVDLKEHRLDLSPNFVPVGRVPPYGRCAIMTADGTEAAFGSSGELWISGRAVGRGYRGMTELTKERFLPHLPGHPDSGPCYRTGDLARYLEDGQLEILGRVDFMVKVRGYSVVLGAVETAIMKLLAVDACVVTASGAEGEDKRLIAYMVPGKEAGHRMASWKLDQHGRCPEIYRELLKELPHYAVPSSYVELGALPLIEASAKCDRKKLPAAPPAPPRAQLPEGLVIKPGAESRAQLVRNLSLVVESILGASSGSVGEHDSFFEIGGHSLLAAQLLSQVRGLVEGSTAGLNIARFVRQPTVAGLCSLLLGDGEGGQDSVVASSKHLMNGNLMSNAEFMHEEVKRFTEACLVPSVINMQVRAFWRYIVYTRTTSRVLLTGSTGFLGAFLLREFLLHTECQLFVLVRLAGEGGSGETGPRNAKERETALRARVLGNLEKYVIPEGHSDERLAFERLFDTRVHILEGDVSLMKLGLPNEEYQFLCMNIDVVVHAAAKVNLLLPYEALQNANVRGTAHVIEFAQNGKIKALHYVSTDGVFPEAGDKPVGGPSPWHFDEDAEDPPPPGELKSGYGQTKWVAEQLVKAAAKAGLPAAIYRLGNLSGPLPGQGSGREGVWNTLDANLHFWAACIRVQAVPELSPGVAGQLRLEMTPVDFVARFIVESARDVEFSNKHTFHLVNPALISVQQDFAPAAGQCIGAAPLRSLPLADWLKRHHMDLAKNPGRREIEFDEATIHALFVAHHSYGRANVNEALTRFFAGPESSAQKFSTYPVLGREELASYLSPLIESGALPQPDPSFGQIGRCKPGRGRLAGRVAMVTGASSGIGEGICRALAAEGASLVLCARRRALLETLKDDLDQAAAGGGNGGLTLIAPMDVTKRDEVLKGVAMAEAELGPVDMLVNCAGVMYFTLMKNQHWDEWDQTVDVCCHGTVNCCGAVFKGMVERKSGHIVNISSDAAKTVFPALTVYNAAKAFVNVFSKGLRAESVGTGVRVTDIQPGDVATELIMRNSDKEAAEKVGVSVGEKISGERASVLDVEDVANAVVYALTAPAHVGVHEILIEPRDQMFGDPTAMNS